jgi:hypothetical protein
MRWGPTSANSLPIGIIFVASPPYAFNRRPLSCALSTFAGRILKGSKSLEHEATEVYHEAEYRGLLPQELALQLATLVRRVLEIDGRGGVYLNETDRLVKARIVRLNGIALVERSSSQVSTSSGTGRTYLPQWLRKNADRPVPRLAGSWYCVRRGLQ